jgi:hypothetical protein
MGGDTYCTDAADRSQVFEKCNIPLERQVQDSHVNNYGYKLIDLCKNSDLYIVNSQRGSDKFTGGTTCKNSSTVDFVLSSVHLFEHLLSFDIVEFCNLYSDVHNPIYLTITRCNFVQTPANYHTGERQSGVKLWSQDKEAYFPLNTNAEAVQAIGHKLDALTIGDFDHNYISIITCGICNIFSNAAKETFGIIYPQRKQTHRNKPLFNRQYRAERRKFHLATRIHSKSKTDENKDILKTASKTIRKQRMNVLETIGMK